MVLSADSSNGGAVADSIPGSWVSDGTFPAAVVSSTMTVSGSGSVTLAWSLALGGGAGPVDRVKIRRNGVDIPGAGGTTSGTTTITVAAGDTLVAWFTGAWGDWYRLAAGSWIEVRPS